MNGRFPPQALPFSERDDWYRAQAFPSHPLSEFDCGCLACAQWRAAQVVPGMLVRPMTHFDGNGSPAWKLNEWEKTGWSQRLESMKITHGLVLFLIDKNDKNNGGHLNCVALLCSNNEIRVTSREWLVDINKPTK